MIAPPLSRYSFQFPHFGDCTHDGQPSSHGHAATRSSVARDVARRRPSNASSAMPAPPGIAVVHEDRRLAGLRVQRHRHAADVPAVADREQRQHADEPVLGRVHRAEQLGRRRCPAASSDVGRHRVPARARRRARARAGRGRTTSITPFVEICLRWYATTWLRHLDRAEVHDRRRRAARLLVGDDRDVGLGARLGVLVASSYGSSTRDVIVAGRAARRGTAGPGAGRPRPGCATANTRASSTVPIVRSLVGVDEPVLDRRTAAQPDAARAGERSPDQYMLPAARREQVGVHELAHGVVEAVAEPALVVGRERQLVRRARDLRAQHERVLRVHDRALGRAARAARAGCATYHWSSWSSPATSTAADAPAGAPGAPGLLPHRRERAGEAVEHHRVEPADVDAELERVRRRDAEQLAAREVELELAPLLGRGSRRGTRRRGRASSGSTCCEPTRARAARRARRRGGCA